MAAPASASWRSPVVESAVGGGHTDKVGETHSQSALGEDTQVPETVGETKGTEGRLGRQLSARSRFYEEKERFFSNLVQGWVWSKSGKRKEDGEKVKEKEESEEGDSRGQRERQTGQH